MSMTVQSTLYANLQQKSEVASISANSMPRANMQSNINAKGRVVKKAKSIRLLLLEAQLERIRLVKEMISLTI